MDVQPACNPAVPDAAIMQAPCQPTDALIRRMDALFGWFRLIGDWRCGALGRLGSWWAQQDSNLQPTGYESGALPLSYGPPVRLKRV